MLISPFAQKGGFGLLIIPENQTDLRLFKRLKNTHIYLTKHGKIVRFLL